MKNLVLTVLLLMSTKACKSSENNDNRLIKQTVFTFFEAVKKGDSLSYKNVYRMSDGGDSYEYHFLNRNYLNINPNNILLKSIKIKDTFNAGTHMKYVAFTLRKPHYEPYETNQDLKMYLMFWKKVGYNKVNQMFIIGNMPKWEGQKPLDLNALP